jgi:hypothetical protein
MKNLSIKNFDSLVLDENFSENESFSNAQFLAKKISKYNLSSCIKYIYLDFNNNLYINDELPNKLSAQIAFELAQAIDENSVEKVKQIKQKYLNTKEFLFAKDFLNKKCKEVWSVYDKKIPANLIPKAAMKTLGITNQPTLEFLLADSLKFYEKDNGSTTVEIISSILKNEKLQYSFQDIYGYLKKNKTHYNMVTTSYLCEKLDYDPKKLLPLGIDKQATLQTFKNLSLKNKLKYLQKFICYSFVNNQ